MADPDSRQAFAAPKGIPSPDESGDFGFIPLPERDFFALNLDSTLLLPVDLPAGEEDGTVPSGADQSADERGKAMPGAGSASPADGHDAPDTGDMTEVPDERALLATMAKLVEEVAAETGVAHLSVPPSPPATAPKASAAHFEEASAGNFETDMSATLSELEKILEEVTGKEPQPLTTPAPVSLPGPAAPRPAPRAPHASLSATEYASPGEDGALLPLPDLDAISAASEENSEPSGPSWDILWASKLAREAQEAPEPEGEERPFISFIPPEDAEEPSAFGTVFPAADSGGAPPASAGGLPTPKTEETAPARSVEAHAKESDPETTPGAEPVRAAARSFPQPVDSAIPVPDASRQSTPGTEADGNSKRRPHPAAATASTQTAAVPRPGPLFPPRGDEATRHTLAELRRLLAEMALKGDGLRRPVSRAADRVRAAAPDHPHVRRSPTLSVPAPCPVRRADVLPTPDPTPTSPAAPTVKPAAPARMISPEKPSSAPPVMSPPGPEDPERAPEATPGPITGETPSVASVDSPAHASASDAASDAVTAMPDTPIPSAAVLETAPLAEAEAAPAPPAGMNRLGASAPENVPAAVKTPSSRLGRLAARLKRILRPKRPLPDRVPQISLATAAPTPAAGDSSPAAATPPAEETDAAGGLIRRLRDMEAEHRARLRTLTERPRGAVYPSWKARRNLLNISLAADIPETPSRPAPAMPPSAPDGDESAETLRVLLDRPSVWRRMSAALRGRLEGRLQDGAFREGLRAVGGVLVLCAVVGALLYVALHPDQLDKILHLLY